MRKMAGTAFVVVVLSALAVVGAAVASAETVPYDATKALVQLGTGTADAQGNVTETFTLPPEVTSDFEVIASGTGLDGQPRSVIADVNTGSAAGALAPAGHLSRQAVMQSGGSTVTVTATGFKPNSTVRFSVRFTAAQSGSGLTRTGSDITSKITVAVAAIVLGMGALAWGRSRRRHASV